MLAINNYNHAASQQHAHQDMQNKIPYNLQQLQKPPEPLHVHGTLSCLGALQEVLELYTQTGHNNRHTYDIEILKRNIKTAVRTMRNTWNDETALYNSWQTATLPCPSGAITGDPNVIKGKWNTVTNAIKIAPGTNIVGKTTRTTLRHSSTTIWYPPKHNNKYHKHDFVHH